MNTPVDDVRAWVRDYYGRQLQGSGDLKTSACCVAAPPPPHVAAALAHIHPDVSARFYGCGWPIPEALDGATVLDLGCGTGRDVYLLAQLVGPRGHVHGVDMTEAQLQVAWDTRAWHAERAGLSSSNVSLHLGYIEDLSFLPDASVDVVVSNCVVNLSPRKDLVLAEAHRVLKPGGELYLSDVLADRRLPAEVLNDPLLHAECLGGAMYDFDFDQLAKRTGFLDPRVLRAAPIQIEDPALRARAGAARFTSVTSRLFKLDGLEPRCEDYGQVATLIRPIPDVGAVFHLDDHHTFELGRPERVCGNTASMLSETRLAAYFRVDGDRSRHFGVYPCGPTLVHTLHAPTAAAGACC
jgi:SAM-dependent methyltransferase